MTTVELREWVEFVAVLIGIVAGLVSLDSIRRDRKKEAGEQAEREEARDKAAREDAELRLRVQRDEEARQLRLDEVTDWGRRCIETTSRLRHALAKATHDYLPEGMDREIALLSALIDEGRLYFRNVPVAHGDEKPLAYQGIRPLILDPLIACYGAACAMESASRAHPASLIVASRRAQQEFVTLLQSETGRARTASALASSAGFGSPLDRYLRAE